MSHQATPAPQSSSTVQLPAGVSIEGLDLSGATVILVRAGDSETAHRIACHIAAAQPPAAGWVRAHADPPFPVERR